MVEMGVAILVNTKFMYVMELALDTATQYKRSIRDA